TTESIPETTTESIPETTTESIPETTTESIPDTTITDQPIVDKKSSTSSSEKSEVTEIFSENTNSQTEHVPQTNSDEKILNNNHLENKKQNNLSVEDIELGKILNQINLECDDSKFTDTITYYDGMGPALYRLCNFENSLNFFNDSLIKDPENVEVLVNKGSTLGKLGYYSESIEYYNQAINVNPEFLPAKNNKANALAYLGNEKEAVLIYEEILDANPNYITAQKNLEILKSELNNELQPISKNFEPTSIVHTITESKSSEIKKQTISQKEKSSNFFDEVSIVLGSLFGFLN
ncbi:tetratricopeptide repeat protein, partial [Nitrosopumilus sp.]|uniref:tetratricopeptide repeat protein n=1 Tax=Nitrosopumilus sp. TaxID=2024843 RepID=UPI00261B4145